MMDQPSNSSLDFGLWKRCDRILHLYPKLKGKLKTTAEIWVSFKLREQKEPEGIVATYAFMPANNVRNLRITYPLIIITGILAGFITTWWRQGWMWTALGGLIILWLMMFKPF